MATITNIGNTTNTSATASSPQTVTTTAAVAAHEGMVLVVENCDQTTGITSVTDSAGNAWAKAYGTNTNRSSEIWYCADPASGLASGSTITVNHPNQMDRPSLWAFKCDGVIVALDGNTFSSGGSANPAVSTVGSVPAGSAKFGGAITGNTNSGITNPTGDWVTDYGALNNSRPTFIAHAICAATGVQTFNPLFGGSGACSSVIAAFSISGGGGGGSNADSMFLAM